MYCDSFPHDCIMNKCARKMTKRVQCQGIVTMLVNCIITYVISKLTLAVENPTT